MSNSIKSLKYVILLALLIQFGFCYSQSVATYTIVFTSNWNAGDHGTLPVNAHWSPLICTTHNSDVAFWELGELASQGIEDMAETGNNSNLINEIDIVKLAGNADQWIEQAFNPNNENGIATVLSIDVSEDFPLLTMLSMIAPSPDWFIGVNGISLLDGDNNWKSSLSIDMFPYDAGTEDGSSYKLDNSATSPQQDIHSAINITPFNDQKIGTLSITLKSVLAVAKNAVEPNFRIFPNPTNGRIYINADHNFNINEVLVFDVLGNKVNRIDQLNLTSNTSIDLSNLTAGIYLIQLNDLSGTSYTKKVVLTR